MKTNKFVQFFDSLQRPILGTVGTVSYHQGNKTPATILKSLRAAKKVPTEAIYFSIYKTMLKSNIRLTELIPITNDIQTSGITQPDKQ